MSGRRHSLFRNRSKISKENSSGRMDSLWGPRSVGENPGAARPKRTGAYHDTHLAQAPVPSPLTRLNLRPQDSSAVSTRFLSAENIFRMLTRWKGSRSVGAKVKGKGPRGRDTHFLTGIRPSWFTCSFSFVYLGRRAEGSCPGNDHQHPQHPPGKPGAYALRRKVFLEAF